MVTGGCLCGAVRYEIDVDVLEDVSYCHCTVCRRSTGSAFVIAARAPSDKLRWTGAAPKRYRSSTSAWRGFCGDCGSPICFQYVDKPEYHALAAGCLDRPRFEARRALGRREPHSVDQDRRRPAAERDAGVARGQRAEDR